MTTTTSGERFTDTDHAALARLLYKRFGRDEESFCAAWRRMLQNNAENAHIMKLLREFRPQERQYLKADLLRGGAGEVREFREDLLDVRSCEVLRRHLRRTKTAAEQDGRRKAIRQPWRR